MSIETFTLMVVQENLCSIKTYLLGGAADVGRKNAVVEAPERAVKLLLGASGLGGVDVDGTAGELLALDGLGKRVEVHDFAARGVDEVGALLHLGELLRRDHVASLGRQGHVHGDDVALLEQRVERRDILRVAERELGQMVVELDDHAHGLSEHRDLGTDMAVAHDAEGLAAGLPAVGGNLVPLAEVALAVAVADLAQQHNDLGNYHLGHGAGVGEGRVEHGLAALGRGRQVRLVSADAEAAHGEQALGRLEDLGRDLRLAADAEDVAVGDGLEQLVLAHGRVALVHQVALVAENLRRGVGNLLQEKDLE